MEILSVAGTNNCDDSIVDAHDDLQRESTLCGCHAMPPRAPVCARFGHVARAALLQLRSRAAPPYAMAAPRHPREPAARRGAHVNSCCAHSYAHAAEGVKAAFSRLDDIGLT